MSCLSSSNSCVTEQFPPVLTEVGCAKCVEDLVRHGPHGGRTVVADPVERRGDGVTRQSVVARGILPRANGGGVALRVDAVAERGSTAVIAAPPVFGGVPRVQDQHRVQSAVSVLIKVLPLKALSVIVQSREDWDEKGRGEVGADQITPVAGVEFLAEVGRDPLLDATFHRVLSVGLFLQVIGDLADTEFVYVVARRKRAVGVLGKMHQEDEELEGPNGGTESPALLTVSANATIAEARVRSIASPQERRSTVVIV